MPRIKAEGEILKADVRKKLIEEIEGSENRARKAEAFKRHQCYRDKTSDYVVEVLMSQFDSQTVKEMQYSLSNISIVRKIVDKLARVYSCGAERSLKDDNEATDKLQKLANLLNLQTEMKKTNHVLKLQKNAAFYVKPCPKFDVDGKVETWTIKPEVLHPYLYDVVEDYYDRTAPLVFILSSYKPETPPATLLNSGIRPEIFQNIKAVTQPPADNLDQKIADSPVDQYMGEPKHYIFWSKHFHFTCDEQGNIVKDVEGSEQTKNPFAICPIVNFALDQDGAFWAQGGKDLIDGAILVNAIITHTLHVGVTQGYGQFWMSGENLPTHVKVGPNKVIRAEYKKDEQAEPKFGFLNADPKLDSLKSLIEMYIALLLTTNNLSTSGVAIQLGSVSQASSGIALAIDKSESLEDVQDQQQLFIDKEAEIFRIIAAEIKAYQSSGMDEKLTANQLPDKFEEKFSLKFPGVQTMVSEADKLENLKVREELGLESRITMIMKDDPSLTREKAEAKFMEILEDKIKQKLQEQKVMKAAGIEYDETNPPPQDPANPEDPNKVKDENYKDDNLNA